MNPQNIDFLGMQITYVPEKFTDLRWKAFGENVLSIGYRLHTIPTSTFFYLSDFFRCFVKVKKFTSVLPADRILRRDLHQTKM